MHKPRFYIPVVLTLALILGSCANQNDSRIDTDVVNNSKSASETIKPYELPKITFAKTEHDFGKLIQGEMVRYSFKFTNTGKSDLILSNVSSSCGCTVSSFSKTPVEPGAEGQIEVIFDSRGRKGIQNKTITVMSNTQPNKTMLSIKANVVLPENK